METLDRIVSLIQDLSADELIRLSGNPAFAKRFDDLFHSYMKDGVRFANSLWVKEVSDWEKEVSARFRELLDEYEKLRTFARIQSAVLFQCLSNWKVRWRKRNRQTSDKVGARIFRLRSKNPKKWPWSELARKFGISKVHACKKFNRHKAWMEQEKKLKTFREIAQHFTKVFEENAP